MTKALTVAELNKRIDGLNNAANKMMEDYQEVGLMCLQHLKDHGDIGPCNRLQTGMPKGARKLAMGVWMLKHGSLRVNTDKGTRDTTPMAFAKDRETNMETATAKKWYDEIPERKVTDVVDLQVMVKQLIQRCQGKTIKIGGENKPHEAHSMLKMLAVGVGLPNPFAAEEQAAAEAAAKAASEAAAASAKDAVNAAAGEPAPTQQAPGAGDKPTTVRREARATAQGGDKPARKAAAKKGGRARANA